MALDINIPTDEIRELCACPVDWQAIEGFGDECPNALALLHYEWARSVAAVSVSDEEVHLIESVLFDDDLYDAPDESVRINLSMRKPVAVDRYRKGIGGLGRLRFIRPSEHGKHYSVTGPKTTEKNISFFYVDWQPSTLANLFWSWFSDMMRVNDIPQRSGPIDFMRAGADRLWDRFCAGREIRIAINVCVPVGARNGEVLHHVAIDLNLDAAVAHGYPISEGEAAAIMAPAEVRLIKARE